MSKLILIDGNAILHRAFHALPRLTNKDNEPTNAIYGFVSMLLKVINDLKPSHLAVAFDLPGPTFRHELYEDYQSHRPKAEDDLVSQIDKIHHLVHTMKIPVFVREGYEADDVIGSLALHSRQVIDETIILTGDKDLMQLVTKKVKLLMPVKGLSQAKMFGEEEVVAKMDCRPDQIVAYKALVGDPSDNYPGVRGIGPKTATNLLVKYEDLESIYQHLDEINPSVAQKLSLNKENAFLSQKLAKVKVDLNLKFEKKQLIVPKLATREVIEEFGELGFKTLLKRLMKLEGKKPSAISHQLSVKEDNTTKKDNKKQLGLF